MSKSRVVFLLWTVGLCLGLAALQFLLKPDPDQRHYEIFTEMAYSRASEAFTSNAWFEDGKTLQPLVAGVVPRGQLPFPYGLGPEEAGRAGRELSNPVDPQDVVAFVDSCFSGTISRGEARARGAIEPIGDAAPSARSSGPRCSSS